MNLEMPHRRLNPLTNEWVLVSPHRTRRPWLGQIEELAAGNLPEYDPTCYLCPGNSRAGDQKNPLYTSTFVFDNDFSALLPDAQGGGAAGSPETPPSRLFVAEAVTGVTRVVCFSPRHDLHLPQLTQKEVEAVVRTWRDQTLELGNRENITYVQIFENKGAMMGASNPHPHSQIWASSHVPNGPTLELRCQDDYAKAHDTCLLCDYLDVERMLGERLVVENQHFTALVPYWAVWPFEMLLVSHRHFSSMPMMQDEEISALAEILRRLTARYDNLYKTTFPYSMGFHQAPTDGQIYQAAHFHAHYYPPLLRSATVRKFMVGYEMLAMPQRDLTPEMAAAQLRCLSETHYRQT
jgi:UDPglucose--hexose-1-phosphate uridylyltransferase